MDLDRVSEHFGGDASLAAALRVTVGAISQWRTAGRIPDLRQYQIQVLTLGRFTASPMAKASKAAA
jgi:hypothetical protein